MMLRVDAPRTSQSYFSGILDVYLLSSNAETGRLFVRDLESGVICLWGRDQLGSVLRSVLGEGPDVPVDHQPSGWFWIWIRNMGWLIYKGIVTLTVLVE
jgi:hypothetical protein